MCAAIFIYIYYLLQIWRWRLYQMLFNSIIFLPLWTELFTNVFTDYYFKYSFKRGLKQYISVDNDVDVAIYLFLNKNITTFQQKKKNKKKYIQKLLTTSVGNERQWVIWHSTAALATSPNRLRYGLWSET